ncbi:hypothetical protein QMK50_23935 [Pseudomonas sp. P5_152]|uniref:hypothetical protein n=1 Tax=Pseudomonas sp. P5_152 TaxID=3043442 RepID=UPI002A35A281|nr:hypothetical protein [Pseudomonas sp. P5_152]MDX9668004.1 hypothetical protein [Pseudomonas sp. P5_152]
MKSRLALFFIFNIHWFISTTASAEGELMVMPASTKLFNSHEQKISLRNMGDSTLYLSVSVQKVMNPGQVPEEKVSLGELPHPGLIATPEKLTLGPNQSRVVTLKSLGEPEQEALYRLYVVPVRSIKIEEAPDDKITAPMSVSIGYGVLVRHMPAPSKQHSSWTYRCENAGLTLVNNGNVRQILSELSNSSGTPKQTIALFPGTPQHFVDSQLKFQVDGQPQTLTCP